MECTNFSPEQCAELALFVANAGQSFDPELYDLAFYSGLKMWAIGLTIGLLVSTIRKLRR